MSPLAEQISWPILVAAAASSYVMVFGVPLRLRLWWLSFGINTGELSTEVSQHAPLKWVLIAVIALLFLRAYLFVAVFLGLIVVTLVLGVFALVPLVRFSPRVLQAPLGWILLSIAWTVWAVGLTATNYVVIWAGLNSLTEFSHALSG
jgi:hypothetical protein